MRRVRASGLACIVAAVVFVAAGCGGSGSSKPTQAQSAGSSATTATTATTVAGAAGGAAAGPSNLIVTEKDFAIDAPMPTAKDGAVTFNVANEGPSAHEFLIFKTDLAPDKLPLGSDGRVNEDSPQVNKVFDSEANIDPNSTKSFNTTLAPGHYVLVCNLAPNHYMAGMHTELNVT